MSMPHFSKGSRQCIVINRVDSGVGEKSWAIVTFSHHLYCISLEHLCWGFRIPRDGNHHKGWFEAGLSCPSTKGESTTIVFMVTFLSILFAQTSHLGGALPSFPKISNLCIALPCYLLVSLKFFHLFVIQFKLNKYKVESHCRFDGIKSWMAKNDIVCHRNVYYKKFSYNGL